MGTCPANLSSATSLRSDFPTPTPKPETYPWEGGWKEEKKRLWEQILEKDQKFKGQWGPKRQQSPASFQGKQPVQPRVGGGQI